MFCTVCLLFLILSKVVVLNIAEFVQSQQHARRILLGVLLALFLSSDPALSLLLMVLLTAAAPYFTILLLIRCRLIYPERLFLEIATIAITTTTGNTGIRQTIFRVASQAGTMVARLVREVGQDLLHSAVVVYNGSAFLQNSRKQSIRVTTRSLWVYASLSPTPVRIASRNGSISYNSASLTTVNCRSALLVF